MFYRILLTPPGYASHEKYMVVEYKTLEYASSVGNVTSMGGSRFFANLEEARKAIPDEAKQLPFEPEDQFVELWAAETS